MFVVDIESHPIVDGAPLLPEPVGVSIRCSQTGEVRYWSWGHPTGNNCTFLEARAALAKIWGEQWITHNGCTFDVPVLQHHFSLPPRDPLKTHDTLFLAYLHNPHARSLSLKDLAQDWLNIPATERDELNDWIMANTDCPSRKKAGAYIYLAPAQLVGKYADADTAMTLRLFEYLRPLVLPVMQEPYNRERKLAPILADIQNTGVRCDDNRLADDFHQATFTLHQLDDEVRRVLNKPTLNPESNDELVEALKGAGFDGFLKTPKGADSANKKSLDHALAQNPGLRGLLHRRSTYATLVSTFMESWLTIARANGGRIHAAYNQVRNPDGFGTRTGRLSSSKPNFQNVPNDLGAGFPVMKSYLLPDEGHVWTKGDFKAQEPRLAAHFEDGALCRAFNDDPELDPYIFVLQVVGGITRKEAKTILLGILYAMGVGAMAGRLECEESRASMLRNMIKAALPDIVALDRECKRRFSMGASIVTLGGRHYFCEPPANGRTWEYKALNTLIQGSAADQTKEALIFANHEIKLLDSSCRILGTVHDEFSISHPYHLKDQIHEIMQLAANALPCDVPMRMDIHTGTTWGEAA